MHNNHNDLKNSTNFIAMSKAPYHQNIISKNG